MTTDIYSLSAKQRRVFLERLALRLIRGEEITQDEKEWLGYGLMAMACGDNLNDAFRVAKKPKSADQSKHAVRWVLVEREIAQGKTREKAIGTVAESLRAVDDETVRSSWKKQNKIQEKLQKEIKIRLGGENNR